MELASFLENLVRTFSTPTNGHYNTDCEQHMQAKNKLKQYKEQTFGESEL